MSRPACAEPCADGQHRWGGSWPVHYNGGRSTNHVRTCRGCGWHGVVIRYSNRNSALRPMKPEDYEGGLGVAIRKRERVCEQSEVVFRTIVF